MQRTQRKLLDVANSMGISDRILKLADRRNKGDAVLVYGGMVRLTLWSDMVLLPLYWYTLLLCYALLLHLPGTQIPVARLPMPLGWHNVHFLNTKLSPNMQVS